MWLIVDDMRELGCDVVARTPQAGKDILYNMANLFDSFEKSLIKCLCIDHDLGFEETGYDVIKWAIEHNCLPERVQIVLQNPVGADRIRNLLTDAGYTSTDRIDYFK